MSNLIHDFALNVVTGHQWTNKEVRIEGYETDKSKLMQLKEMFARAEWNVIYKERTGGPSFILDLTGDQRNLRVCNFSTEELITGWYALKSFTYSPRQDRLGHFPYRITLLYIGTMAGYQRYYEVQNIESVTNDWGI